MDRQPKYLPQAESSFFYNGSTLQLPVEGTLARGELQEDEEYYRGRSAWGFFVAENPQPVTGDLLARGRERFRIYCVPCHGESGDGRGVMFTRSQVESADLRESRLRQMPDGRLYDVITNGSGLMPGYRYPIPPRDRWAIVAYVRQLQGQG